MILHFFYLCIGFQILIHVNSQLITWSNVYESPMTKDPMPGWARFCKDESVYDTFANQCPVGVFWNEANDTQWDCVCTRGPWRRSSGWCSNEDTQRFTQGAMTCFPLDSNEKGLRGMYYLGDQFSAWDSNTPILLTDYRSGFPIRKGDSSVEWDISSRSGLTPGILLYRPRDDWAVENKNPNNKLKLCLRAPENFDDDSEGLFIYNVSQIFEGAGESLKLSFTRGCFGWEEHDESEWESVTGENLVQKNMVVPAYNAKTASDACIKCMSKAIPPAPVTDIDGDPLEERDGLTTFDLKNVAVLKTEVDLQTERLGHYWAHRMLIQNGTDFVPGSIQEMEILTKAAILALNTCDTNYVPFEFYQYFLIMFKMLLSESFKKYPPKGPISDAYYSEINKLLDKCNRRNLSVSFNMSESCPSIFVSFTAGSPPETRAINTTSDYTSEKGRHDFLLEFIWRLKSFLHYKCFEEFQTNSILHDVIQHQLESLFSEDLILRWYNPGNSFQMYRLIFENHFDLDTVMKNFQRCVIAAHDLSKYPVWLKRPIDRPEVKPRKSVSGSRRRKRSLSPRLRRKRDAEADAEIDDEYEEDEEDELTPPYNLFGGSAACIKSIKTFISESNQSADSKCW